MTARALRCVAILMAAVACGRIDLPDRPPRAALQQRRPEPSLQNSPERVSVQPCRVTVEEMEAQAGGGAQNCSLLPSMRAALACAAGAFRARKPFTLCSGWFGMDSWIENGLAGLPDGNLMLFYFDGFGPRYRGICPRAEVSFKDGSWPVCRRSLLDQIDLTTGQRFVDFSDTFGEPWPRPCAAKAAAAVRAVAWPRVLHRTPLITHPDRWKLRCGRFGISFEMLIDRSGNVTCARIAEPVDRWAPDLAQEVRFNLKRWRFAPPTIGGEPVDIRWLTTEREPCGPPPPPADQ